MQLTQKLKRETNRVLSQMPWSKAGWVKEVRIRKSDIGKIGTLPYQREKPNSFFRIFLPSEILIMKRGLPFSAPHNPFVAALKQGSKPLEELYENFQPTNLAQMYGLKERGLAGEQMNQFSEPWLPGTKTSLEFGEAGLGAEHGISHYGPVTPEKLKREMQRLTATLASIEKNGFDPDKYGDINGYFMRSGDQYRFQIAGGKHRIAALVHLGWEEIPVRMRPGWPRLIDRSDYKNWPRVAEGQIDQKLALEIFDRYFEIDPFAELPKES